ncbi:uncharacterized protein LOC119733716 [Patiria miniata]|uniref:Uncharacterized protein n=1 Tax=Patiria miniata TaxID=46514 RepID=A0A914AH56_PATMI|nr:uncharacterized protein LOC119733716 [Patiria miniata]
MAFKGVITRLVWCPPLSCIRWLVQYGIKTASEHKMRALQKAIIDNNVLAEYHQMKHTDEDTGGSIIKSTPCVPLVHKVHQQLDAYDKTDQLTWHDGLIPADEIWLKLGGDKGGKIFKQMFQMANLQHPNSPQHTIVVCAFEATDSQFNMDLGLMHFREQVVQLMSSQWRGRKFKLFVFGDYKYFCKIYGLTGPTGRHCCLWCTMQYSDMRLPLQMRTKNCEPRSLESMKRSLDEFRSKGGIPAKAKNFHNVIREPLMSVPLSQVCIPGLHISLGLFMKHFNSFENNCHRLDMEVSTTLSAQDIKDHDDSFTSSYKNLVQITHSARSEDAQAKAIADTSQALMLQMTTLAVATEPADPAVQMLAEAHANSLKLSKSKALWKSRDTALKTGKGPIAGVLDTTLKTIRVCRQAYHGGSFVGNHVHKCSRELSGKYQGLFTRFAECHNVYNSASIMTDDIINKLEEDITSYCQYFRVEFTTDSCPPKFHMLVEHIIPFIKQWRFGLGFLGEQGGEGVHARLNNIR